MNPIFWLISTLCTVIFFIVIVSVIFSWLVAFNVINIRNPLMARVYSFVNSFSEALYRPIRKVVPTIYGGMDISPVIVMILIKLVQYTLAWLTFRFGL